MPRTTPFVRTLDGLIELGWLFLIIAVPTFFNVRDYRVFEPDKIVLMRNVVLIMVALFLLKMLYLAPPYVGRWFSGAGQATANGHVPVDAGAPSAGPAFLAWLRTRPVVIAATVFMVVYLLATLHSILPGISFWGSYDRMEGFYTYLNYFIVFLLIATQLRSWAQVERLVTAVIVASIPAASYSWLQHFSQDPLVWGSGSAAAQRTPSTMGNPIFMAAFMVMCVPFTLYRLLLRIQSVLRSSTAIWEAVGAVGYGVAAVLQIVAIGFSGSRGPALGFLAALVVFGLSLSIRQRITWLLRASAAFAVLLVLVFGATNTVFRNTNSTPSSGLSRLLYILPSESDTSEVRSLLWKSSFVLFKAHPVLGCGPEVLLFCWYPDYPADLRKIEAANAAPDRSHNEEIDVLLMSGLLGELAYLAVLGTTIAVLVTLVRRARDLRSAALASALLAAFIGHIVEGFTGIAFSATLLLLWSIAGAATALRAGPASGAAGSFLGGEAADLDVAATGAVTPDGAAERATPVPGVAARQPDRQRRNPSVVPEGAAAAVAGRGPSGQRSGRSAAVALNGGGNSRKNRQATARRNGSGQGPAPRRTFDRGDQYSFTSAFSRLPGAAQGLLGLGILAFVGIVIGFGALFAGNVQVVLADVSYRTGQGYETSAVQYTTPALAAQAKDKTNPNSAQAADLYKQGLVLFQTAIDNYQQALNAEPTQDSYFLYLGKTMFEYADALNRDPSGNSTRADAVAEIQAALSVFQRAARNNPLNPDHPRNMAKLYDFWGWQAFGPPANIPKLDLADQSFAHAAALAPHNADILDEWAVLDILLGQQDTARAHQWYDQARTHLERAKGLFPEDGNVYRDLGQVYYQYGQWAEQAKRAQVARGYYRQAADDWLKALGGSPVTTLPADYQSIYPRLAALFVTKLGDTCDGGQYALYALNAIKANAVPASTPQLVKGLQLALSNAQAQKCTIRQQ